MKLVLDATNIAAGGGLIVLSSILKEWQRQGRPIDVSIFISRGDVGDFFSTARPDVTIHPFMLGSSPAKVYFGRKFVLGRHIEKCRPDMVMAVACMLGNCSVPQLVHHQNLRCLMEWPFWETIRGHGLKKTLRWRRQTEEAMLTLKKARYNTFISDYMRRLACELVPESKPHNFTISNAPGVPIKTDGLRVSRGPLIAAIQSNDYYKDSPTLVRAFAKCVELRPDVDWRLKIAGSGNWENIREMAVNLGIADRITFLGYCSQTQIVKLLDEAFCLVFPSTCEGFGIPPLEAMARGCCVVCSNVDALPEVVGDSAVLVEPGNAETFAAAAVELYDNPVKRGELIDAGMKQVKKFSWQESAEKLARLIIQQSEVHLEIKKIDLCQI